MDKLVVAGKELSSRLWVGTGKYPTFQVMKDAHFVRFFKADGLKQVFLFG